MVLKKRWFSVRKTLLDGREYPILHAVTDLMLRFKESPFHTSCTILDYPTVLGSMPSLLRAVKVMQAFQRDFKKVYGILEESQRLTGRTVWRRLIKIFIKRLMKTSQRLIRNCATTIRSKLHEIT